MIFDTKLPPVRVQRMRIAGWRMPPNTVYVGRPTKFGNPFYVHPVIRLSEPDVLWAAFGPNGHQIGAAYYDKTLAAKAAIAFYAEIVEDELQDNPALLDDLRGKNLACWCRLDAPCHADILLALANRRNG